MKFSIISINDDRAKYKNALREFVGLDEQPFEAFNAHEHDPLEAIEARGLWFNPAWGNAKRGELGVWISNYDVWKMAAGMDEPLIVFEDDAIVDLAFQSKLRDFMGEVPEDWDICALWVPENQRQDYLYNTTYDEYGHPRFSGYVTPENSVYRMEGAQYAALVYQGYGMVSLAYSPKGAQRLVELAHERGIDNPVDCWIYEEAHKGNLNGYAPRPEHANLVYYDWKAQSHVQLTERAL